MDLEKRFEECRSAKGFKRIDPSFKVNIFLGYSDNGGMSVIIAEPGRKKMIASSRNIDVIMSAREDGKVNLQFVLLDIFYKPIFLLFCQDIIDVCEQVGSDMAISAATERWKIWKDMFTLPKDSLLTREEVKGLIGELLELKNHFLKDYEEDIAVASWMGPLDGHKDFEIKDTWYEIKAISDGAAEVKISSLEQLASDVDGHLVLVKLDKTSTTFDGSLNLNKLVLDVYKLLKNPKNRELFMMRMEDMKYVPNSEYDKEKYCFTYKGKETYLVNKDFPKLTRDQIANKAVGKASYTLILNAISDFKEN